LAKKVVIVGGGVIGTMHAWRLVKRGIQVVQVERDARPTMASVRNFGLVWIGGRAAGDELVSGLEARALWDELSSDVPGMSFRANGSLTIARTEAELKVIEQSLSLPDADQRGWSLLDRNEVRAKNPALRGNYIAGLLCDLDAAVEPGQVLGSIRDYLESQENYSWHEHTEIVDVDDAGSFVSAVAADGREFEGDLVLVCPGADHKTLFSHEIKSSPLRRVRLQMMSTEPLGEELTTSVADGDSLRYYPAYDVPALRELPPQAEIAASAAMQLLMVQRTDGTLTIGDTHEYQEPFDFKLREAEYEYLRDVASDILGRPLPKIDRRWDGIYSQQTNGEVCERIRITENICLITGPGGRGNSLSPSIAEQTLRELGL
jgi:FAD dependent oxidoreductase TIGR03364